MCSFWGLGKEGAFLEDTEHKAFQWQKSQQQEPHPSRCFHKTMGGALQRALHIGEMVQKGTRSLHKCFRTNTCDMSNLNFHKESIRLNHSYSDNEVDLSYLLKIGGTQDPELLKISKSFCHYLLSYEIMITAEYF